MFKSFERILKAFQDSNFDDPLTETLKYFDFLTGYGIQTADLSLESQTDTSIENLITKRKEQVPFEYIYGETHFLGLAFFCTSDALIPRKETELLAKTAIKKIKAGSSGLQKVIDMGTGSGNIAVSIAANTENTHLLATDLKEKTIELAKKNVERHRLENRIKLFYGDLFAPITDNYRLQIDVVVCNPPYVPSTSLKNLPREIIGHEPKEAFDAGAFGMEFYQRLISDAVLFLKPAGTLIFEIGKGQEKLVTRLFKKNGSYGNIEYFDDGIYIRVISAQKK